MVSLTISIIRVPAYFGIPVVLIDITGTITPKEGRRREYFNFPDSLLSLEEKLPEAKPRAKFSSNEYANSMADYLSSDRHTLRRVLEASSG